MRVWILGALALLLLAGGLIVAGMGTAPRETEALSPQSLPERIGVGDHSRPR